MTWWPTSEIFTTFLTELVLAPSTGIEPVAYRLGGGRSIRLSYEGEGGALCGALLPITVFLAVKVTGEAGLALWESVGGFAPLSVVAPQVGFGAEA